MLSPPFKLLTKATLYESKMHQPPSRFREVSRGNRPFPFACYTTNTWFPHMKYFTFYVNVLHYISRLLPREYKKITALLSKVAAILTISYLIFTRFNNNHNFGLTVYR